MKNYSWKTSSGIVNYGGSVGGVTLDTSLLDRITAEIRPAAGEIVHNVGDTTVAEIMNLAPVDTGALRDSYLEESEMISDLVFRAQDGVPYGIFQELGTSRMAAQPHVVPAMEDAEKIMIQAFMELFA